MGFTNDLFAGAGGGTGDEARASGNTFYSNPGIADQLAQALSGLQTNLAGQYQGLLQNPTASPLFQGQLGPLLQSLVPSENLARQNLTDSARSAGALRSGAYANSNATLEGNILGNRSMEAGKLLGQSFPQLMQALQNPLGQVSSLMDALKLTQQQGMRSNQPLGGGGGNNLSPSLGLDTPMGGGLSTGGQNPQYGPGSVRMGGVLQGAGGYPTTSPTQMAQPVDNSGAYDILSRLLGGGSGTTYNPQSGYHESAPSQNLGTFSPAQGGPTYPAPTPEYDPITGAFQGGYQSAPYVGGDYNTTNWEY